MTGARVRWTADRDGVAHVRISSAIRTPCGVRPVDERHAWPTRSGCPVCTAAVEAITTGKSAGAPAPG